MTPEQLREQRDALAAALRVMVDLHCQWTTGSAYVRAPFVAKNNAALAAARAALAALILSGCGGGGDAPAAEPQTIAERGGAVVSLGGLPAGGHP